ncbi:MAG TPA: molybdopterin-dependent oxidoreductase [Burkholderiales bacterium]|nr:molybdopterin-dependent oxidoreductase [Burkholderiales bacterium]
MHKILRSFLWIGLIVLGAAAPTYSQGQQDGSAALLRVVGADGVEKRVTAEDWAKLPRATVKAVDHGGAEVTFEGVPAREILKLAGAPFGHELRGQRLSLYVLAEASDGYRAIYALPEFDADFTDGLILIADRKNGQALASQEGPLRMVVPWEKRQARWVRELIALRLGQAP